MGGGEAYQGFPVPNPTVSYWQLPPHRIANHRTTPDLPVSTVFDHVIIGSGVSGAGIAYKLLSRDPSLSILMLEARTAASGASGRNGGNCRAGYWLNFKRYVEAFGEDEALKFERLEEQNIQDIVDFVHEHQVDCDFTAVTTSDTFVTQEAFDKVLGLLKYREEVRQRRPDAGQLTPRKVWYGKDAQKRMGIDKLTGAITWPAYTQNPYRLVCRMLELSLEKGLNLQTNTSALDVHECSAASNGARWEVKTERGNVRGRNVILATNAYTNTLHRSLAATKFITPGRSQLAAIRPGTNATGNPALRGSCGVDDVGSGDYFLVREPGLEGEGDIIYGGGRDQSETRERGIMDDSEINPKIAKYLHHAPTELFGKASWGDEGGVVRDWTGITCYTQDTLPCVGESPGEKGLWMSVAMNGHGMAMAFRCAEALVEMITTGAEPEWFPKPLRLARAWDENPVQLRRLSPIFKAGPNGAEENGVK